MQKLDRKLEFKGRVKTVFKLGVGCELAEYLEHPPLKSGLDSPSGRTKNF